MTKWGLDFELSGLVTDFRWTRFRLMDGGLLEAENDIDMLLAALGSETGFVPDANGLSKDVQILRNSLPSIWGAMHKNPRECWFQLFPRLCHLKDSEVINTFLESVEDWHEKAVVAAHLGGLFILGIQAFPLGTR